MSAKTAWLFNDLPEVPQAGAIPLKPIQYPLWSENKAYLVARYLKLFVFITKHGAYIDGFAARQKDELGDAWCAKLVLESRPARLREIWLCDLTKSGAKTLSQMVAAQEDIKGRHVTVLQGDFNARVHDILASGRIREKVATFCLLDQRTFECEWSTVRRLADFKKSNKIELFYFLGTGWLERALSAVTKGQGQVEKWWGGDDWRRLQKMGGTERAMVFCERMKAELGYKHALAWPIYKRGADGRIMYHMVHCSDHDEAPRLMSRAYRAATRAIEPMVQLEMAV